MGKLEIVCGDILNNLSNKDLIVNITNKYMSESNDGSSKIYINAGKALLDYCHNNFNDYMKFNEIRFTPGFDLGIDILHIHCPKYCEYKNLNEIIDELLFSYYKIIFEAKKNNYNSIVSLSLEKDIDGHKEISKYVVERLKYLVYKYDINFTLVLKNERIREIYNKSNDNLKIYEIPKPISIGYIDKDNNIVLFKKDK